ASVAFAKCVQSGIVDAVIVFDEQGRVNYPNSPSAVSSDLSELDTKWLEASRFEHLRKYVEAANCYETVARTATNENTAARAYQSEVRCRLQAGQNDAVVQLVKDVFQADRYRGAVDWHGRLIAPNAELLALELITNGTSPIFQSI